LTENTSKATNSELGRCGHLFNWTAPKLNLPALSSVIVDNHAGLPETTQPVVLTSYHFHPITNQDDRKLSDVMPMQFQINT